MEFVQWTIAAVTAVFVAVVAFQQWRTAQQKAVLDLFERRHAIYEIARKAVATMTSNSTAFDQTREVEILDATERAYFFFGDDVVAYLEQLWSAIMDVRDADKEIPETKDPAAKSELLAKRRAGLNKVARFYNEGKPLFARYMRFAQTVPSRLLVG
jgi:hypothetical protein